MTLSQRGSAIRPRDDAVRLAMENRNDDVRHVGPSEAHWSGPGAQAAVGIRPRQRPPIQRDWDDLAAEASGATETAIGSSRARYHDESPGEAEDGAPLVLIVEDEESIAETLRMIFEDVGCRVALAPNGAAALPVARRERPALILTDLMMPVMDGRELIATLREEAARGARPAAPVVVMTALGHARARDLAVEGMLRKPFELREVDALVERFLGARLGRREGSRAGYGA
jgi:CheY-like chemotaxis protein